MTDREKKSETSSEREDKCGDCSSASAFAVLKKETAIVVFGFLGDVFAALSPYLEKIEILERSS